MTLTPSRRAAQAAETALIVFIGLLALLVFHTTESESVRPAFVTLLAIGMTVAGLVHLVFIALLARRLGRPATWWVVGALLSLPIGSAVGLIVYEWQVQVDRAASGTRPA